MKRSIITFTAACLFAFSTSAQGTVPWKDVGGWNILVDPSVGNACYMTTAYDNHVALRFGFNFLGPKPLLYLAVGNPDWQSLEVGKDYPIQIQFDNNPVWTATASVSDLSGIKFLNVTTEDTGFAQEFSRKLGMTLSFQGKYVTGVRLTGSSAAISEMLNCQRNVNAVVSSKKSPAPPVDPFQQRPSPMPAGQTNKSANDPFSL